MDYLAAQDQLKQLEETLKKLELEARAGVKVAVESISEDRIREIREKIKALNPS